SESLQYPMPSRGASQRHRCNTWPGRVRQSARFPMAGALSHPPGSALRQEFARRELMRHMHLSGVRMNRAVDGDGGAVLGHLYAGERDGPLRENKVVGVEIAERDVL